MFGFGKKNKQKEFQNSNLLAAEIVEIIHKTVEEELLELEKFFKEKLNRTHSILIPIFYTSKIYMSPDYIGYFAGFIEGYLQDKNLSQEERNNTTISSVTIYDKTIVNRRTHFGLSDNAREWSDAFMDFLSNRTFETDKEAGNQMLAGLAEGSAFSKAIKTMTTDYSTMLEQNNFKSIDLTNLRMIIKTWTNILLLDKEKFNFLKASFLESGEWNPNVEEDWAKLNEEEGSWFSSKKTPQKTQKSISKYKKSFNELKNFIENYEFKIKDDEDYYEHDIFFDDNKNIANVKIEVILTEEGPNKPYPFLNFNVDFNNNELTSILGISQEKETFSDINDLKYAIEELIEKQY